MDLNVGAGAQHVFAEIAGLPRFVDGLLENPGAQHEFAADVNVGRLRADGVAGDRDAFQNLMRIALHELAVLEGARLAFVGVAAEVLGALVILGQEVPLHAGREARAAASAQA
jgi:hypothetical protein